MEQVGPALRRIRRLRGKSQTDLARASGVAQDTISQLELGKREPQGRTLRKLAEALDVPLSALWHTEQEVVDLAHEDFVGAQQAITEAPPQERAILVGQERQATLVAIQRWLENPSETTWWYASATAGRWAAVRRAADGDFLDLVGELNELWRQVIETWRQA